MIVFTTKPCPVCGQASTVELDPIKVKRWHDGELIQDVFPELSPDERELLITGTHPKCWDEMFADDESEEE